MHFHVLTIYCWEANKFFQSCKVSIPSRSYPELNKLRVEQTKQLNWNPNHKSHLIKGFMTQRGIVNAIPSTVRCLPLFRAKASTDDILPEAESINYCQSTYTLLQSIQSFVQSTTYAHDSDKPSDCLHYGRVG